MKRLATLLGCGVAAAALTAGAMVVAQPADLPSMPAPAPATSPVGWLYWGGDVFGQKYATLEQITPQNVNDLKVAWTYRTGDLERPDEKARDATYTFEATPLFAANSLFLCTPHNIVIALDPETGKEKWRFDPKVQSSGVYHFACRGVSYYEAPMTPTPAAATPGQPMVTGACRRRILAPTVDGRLFALDADTGRPCADFGQGGSISLLDGMGPVAPGYHYTTSPPVIVNGVAVLGCWVFDNQKDSEPSGVVRAFDPMTGKLVWAWDAGRPGQHGAPPPGESYTRDTPNAWTVFSADPALGLVYVPTGNSPPDFYGAQRSAVSEKFSSSIVAIDVKTGEPRWTFQTVHHDLWDYDMGSQPVLVDIPAAGGVQHALLAPTKRGQVFMLDRLTGQPLAKVEEKKVPGNPAPGDWLSPTQPFSTGMPNFTPPDLREKDMWGATPIDQLYCRIKFHEYRYDGQFTPPTTQGSLTNPGSFGVIDWGSVSVDPARQLMIVNSSWMPYVDTLIPRDQANSRGIHPAGEGAPASGPKGKGPPISTALAAGAGTPFASKVGPFLSPLGFPCHQPPYGHLTAVDLRTHQIAWRHPIGTTRGVAPLGLSLPMGMFNLGGSLVTNGGLVFLGAVVDGYFRAFDEATGKELWKTTLPVPAQAAPMTYVGPASGRQFVVIAAGGHSALKTKQGDYVVAYALPTKG